jgi:hypothetical protein
MKILLSSNPAMPQEDIPAMQSAIGTQLEAVDYHLNANSTQYKDSRGVKQNVTDHVTNKDFKNNKVYITLDSFGS